MRAKAPGKLVVSGAYSVLEGATAIVAAVDRYAVADTGRAPDRETEEVRAAIEMGAFKRAPWFDASELRAKLEDGRDVKLGLGSSAAILVASMAAAWAAEDRTLDSRALFQASLHAHRKAQGGGSGVDVAASTFGGVLACKLEADGSLSVQPHALPHGAVLHAFGSPVSASTPELVGRVRAFAKSEPGEYGRLLGAAGAAAARALAAASAAELVVELRAQARALAALGDASGAPIRTGDVNDLSRLADEEDAAFYPSGAGGGDVALYAGARPPSERFVREAAALGRFHLDLSVGTLKGAQPAGVRGVHLVSTTSPSSERPGAL